MSRYGDALLDCAFCPGCGKRYSRDELAAMLCHGAFVCSCEYEYSGHPHRPPTIRESAEGVRSRFARARQQAGAE